MEGNRESFIWEKDYKIVDNFVVYMSKDFIEKHFVGNITRQLCNGSLRTTWCGRGLK